MKLSTPVLLAVLTIPVLAASEVTANKTVLDGLRSMLFNAKAEEFSLTPDIYPQEVWAILFESGFDGGSITLVVVADGSTSVYFSHGGGIIGAGNHEKVKTASTELLIQANRFRHKTSPVNEFPYPASGEVRFYLIGRDGVTGYNAPEIKLGEKKDPLSDLFHSAHRVITEVRKVEEENPKK